MPEDIAAHGDPPEQVIGLPWPGPARLDFGIQVVEEILRFPGYSVRFPSGSSDNLRQDVSVDGVALRCKPPVPDERSLLSRNRRESVVNTNFLNSGYR